MAGTHGDRTRGRNQTNSATATNALMAATASWRAGPPGMRQSETPISRLRQFRRPPPRPARTACLYGDAGPRLSSIAAVSLPGRVRQCRREREWRCRLYVATNPAYQLSLPQLSDSPKALACAEGNSRIHDFRHPWRGFDLDTMGGTMRVGWHFKVAGFIG